MSREGRGRTFFHLVAEMVLVTIGVFLALWTNNWHEDRQHHAQARAALHNFLGEMETNQRAVQNERAYHETLARELDQFLRSKEPMTEDRLSKEVHFTGIHPVIFEHTAWDLALATQALSYLEPGLAFDISKVYTQQSAFQTLENSFLSSAYTPASLSNENFKGLASAMRLYLGDVNVQEPALLSLYEKVIPKLRAKLDGESAKQEVAR